MRIIAGEFRGRRLRAPEGLSTRPTSDKVRESLFNILGSAVVGARVLDLFAGSGAVGLEALSRGAESVVFVEASRKALALLDDNVEHCGVRNSVMLVQKDARSALRALATSGKCFDFVYVDPPYDAGQYVPVLRLLGSGDLLATGGVVVVESRTNDRLPDVAGVLRRYRDVRHGSTNLGFYGRI
jgi:16S rRNA (guanine(966)-N(2))-methyltransferase RsmD